eukprot:7065090-Lingulodinium_polyedra.AAC.1
MCIRDSLRLRAEVRSRRKEGKLEEIEKELKAISQRLKLERRRAAAKVRETLLEQIQEAWRARRTAEAMSLSRQAARC